MAEEETQAKEKKGFFGSAFFKSQIRSANAKFWPEGVLGYFIGPTLALISNSFMTSYYNNYLRDILGFGTAGGFANAFFTWMPVISVVLIVAGNIIIGRLMDRFKTAAGRARPFIMIAIPLSILAFLFLFIFCPTPSAMVDEAGNLMYDAETGNLLYNNPGALTMVLVAIGYNLWYAIAYPVYFTSHSSLVNLSTRNTSTRSLFATMSNACTLAAMGLVSMILPYLDGIMFYATLEGSDQVDQVKSYHNFEIFVIVIIVLVFVGAVIEFYFTRERITEESLNTAKIEENKKKTVGIGKQWAVCWRDRYWWIIILFYLFYQLGGMLKNVSLKTYCYAMFANSEGYSIEYGGMMAGTLNIVGAIPTIIGMFICWPIARKIGKKLTILIGAAVATLGGLIGFIDPNSFAVVTTAFCIKALGSTPAMYLSLALLADVMDHQEAEHGFRTDGLTMAIYGAIMVGMTGIATGILNAVTSGSGYDAANLNGTGVGGVEAMESAQNALMWVFLGGETICYFCIFLTFFIINVEKYSKRDNYKINLRQKHEAMDAGVEWVPSSVRLAIEEIESNRQSESARVDSLKAKCEKKGLNFEEEEAKYEEERLAKLADTCAKRQASFEKDKAKIPAQVAKRQAKYEKEMAKVPAQVAKRAAKFEKDKAALPAKIEKAQAKYEKEKAKAAAKCEKNSKLVYEDEMKWLSDKYAEKISYDESLADLQALADEKGLTEEAAKAIVQAKYDKKGLTEEAALAVLQAKYDAKGLTVEDAENIRNERLTLPMDEMRENLIKAFYEENPIYLLDTYVPKTALAAETDAVVADDGTITEE